jgi:hypothetical protein
MPCCCASNIKAAFVIGIVLAVLNILNIAISFYDTKIFSIITGFLGLVSASILAYGAHTRNAKAMLIYIGSAILIIILFIVETVLDIVEVEACNDFQGTNQTDIIDWGTNNQTDTNLICSIAAGADGAVGKGIVIFAVVVAVGVIIFDIWTIIVAKNAKKEIEDGK